MPELALNMMAKTTHGRVIGPAPGVFNGISTDSRTVKRGSLFVALKGERFDGHDFIAEARQQGAAAAMVAREVKSVGPLLVVEDTLTALGEIAAAHRATFAIKMIAITGSTGKTTTKEMTTAILAQGWRTVKTAGNYNNEIGVPLTLLDLDASHQAAVVELAMRGKGQIAYLAAMAKPQIGLITNIGVSHVELLGNRDAVAEAKAELLEALPSDGVAVLNVDDDYFDFLRKRGVARIVSFGKSEHAEVRSEVLVVQPDGSVKFLLHGWWGKQELHLKAAGRHQAMNAAAAAATAMAAGAQPEWIAAGLSSFTTADMRGQILKAKGGYTIINDCYNAAPDSMRVALELLADLPGAKKWAVLGDMKELGPLSPEWHREIGELAGDMNLSGLVTVGDMGRYIAEGAKTNLPNNNVIKATDNQQAIKAIEERVHSGDVVLVKGSRAMKMEEIVNHLVRND